MDGTPAWDSTRCHYRLERALWLPGGSHAWKARVWVLTRQGISLSRSLIPSIQLLTFCHTIPAVLAWLQSVLVCVVLWWGVYHRNVAYSGKYAWGTASLSWGCRQCTCWIMYDLKGYWSSYMPQAIQIFFTGAEYIPSRLWRKCDFGRCDLTLTTKVGNGCRWHQCSSHATSKAFMATRSNFE